MTRNRGSIARTAAIAGVAALALTTLGATPADAQTRVCSPQAMPLVEQLGKDYGEVLTSAGVDAGGNLVQVYSSPTGSWTIAVTMPGGPTCIISSGEGWAVERTADLPKPGQTS